MKEKGIEREGLEKRRMKEEDEGRGERRKMNDKKTPWRENIPPRSSMKTSQRNQEEGQSKKKRTRRNEKKNKKNGGREDKETLLSWARYAS